MASRIDLIVPVYNRAHCLATLFADLEKQTFRSFRVLFVDDGSTDESLAVLRTLAEKATFPVTVLSQENGGPAKARNTGLRAADADWIVFADSDDGLLPEYLEYLYRSVCETEADLGFCRYQYIPEEKRDTQVPEAAGEFSCRAVSSADCMAEHLSSWLGICGMIVRRSFQAEKQIFMDEACRYMEDAPFLCELIAAARSAVLSEHGLYLYYTHAGSESRSPRVDKFRDGCACFDRTCQRIFLLDTPASRFFGSAGAVRYYVATLRKAAVQMKYRDFLQVADMVDFSRFRKQVKYLAKKPRLAARILLLSKGLFYWIVNILFKD